MPHHSKILPLLAGLLATYATAGWALESDRQQPIHIKADHITVNEQKGISIYRGHVLMTQGTLRVTGNQITVHLKQNRLLRIIAIGKPATLQQKPEPNQTLIKSRAERMEYDVALNRLLLKTNAEVKQGPNRFSGNQIVYNTLTSTISANKDGNNQHESPDAGRVSVTITPPPEPAPPESPPPGETTP